MPKKNIKERLLNGERCVGLFQVLDHPGVTQIVANTDFDWIVFDVEHGHFTNCSLRNCLEVLHSRDTSSIIRVPENNTAIIKQILDIGPEGVLIPMISNKEECENAVSACKYPPEGIRGIGPGKASNYGNNIKNYLNEANDNILVAIQAETLEAVNNIEEIAKVEGLDMVFIGPFDLSGSMGIPGKTNHNKVLEAIDIIIEACKKENTLIGMWCNNEKHSKKMHEKGVQFIVYSSEAMIFSKALKNSLEKAK